ncbi:hypothetical protein NUG22_29875, partial [Saccharothrix longispora]|nr:hypothetical protein [Saccharothrix longispora]
NRVLAHPVTGPHGAVPPGRDRRYAAVAAAAVAAVVVLAVVAYLVIDTTTRLSGEAAAASTTTPTGTTTRTKATKSGTTQTGTTRTGTTTGTTTAEPTPSPQDQALLAALPAVYRGNDSCVPAPAEGEGVTARVVCTEANEVSPYFDPPVRAEFLLFASRAAQDAHFQAVVTSRGIPRNDARGGCRPTVDAIHYSTYYRSQAGPLDGEFVTCYFDGGAGHLWWVDAKTSVTGTLATGPGATADSLEKLDFWWNSMILSRS